MEQATTAERREFVALMAAYVKASLDYHTAYFADRPAIIEGKQLRRVRSRLEDFRAAHPATAEWADRIAGKAMDEMEVD